MNAGKIYLIGAGCGAYDLITVRGMEVLKHCDAVIYDALIDKNLLDFAPEYAERICVGKRSGHHSETQAHIHEILVQQASQGKTVVRLKGGDPFVFGRGGEECLALQNAGIAYYIIPGISSCIAAAEFAGIPVTHRQISQGFHVITAHTALGRKEIEQYTKLKETLVILMGFEHLRQIANDFINAFMPIDTPVAVISHAGTSEQKVVRSCLINIADDVEKAKLCAPAVIVIGKTAGMQLLSAIQKPLQNISITVTGTRKFSAKLSNMLREYGAQVQSLPYLKIVAYENNSVIQNLQVYQWLVLTSPNGAEIFMQSLRKQKTDIRILAGLKIAVIGSGTAEILENYGLYPDLMPESYTSDALGKTLVHHVRNQDKILILRAEKGSPALTEHLRNAGIAYDDRKIYDVVSTGMTAHVKTDFLIFASASGVEAFFENSTVDNNTKIICIGDMTAKALQKYAVSGYFKARTQNAEGILEIILQEAKK